MPTVVNVRAARRVDHRRLAAAVAPARPGQVEPAGHRERLVEDVEDQRAVALERAGDRAPEVVGVIVGHGALAVGAHAGRARTSAGRGSRRSRPRAAARPSAARPCGSRRACRTPGRPSSPSQQSWLSGSRTTLTCQRAIAAAPAASGPTCRVPGRARVGVAVAVLAGVLEARPVHPARNEDQAAAGVDEVVAVPPSAWARPHSRPPGRTGRPRPPRPSRAGIPSRERESGRRGCHTERRQAASARTRDSAACTIRPVAPSSAPAASSASAAFATTRPVSPPPRRTATEAVISAPIAAGARS